MARNFLINSAVEKMIQGKKITGKIFYEHSKLSSSQVEGTNDSNLFSHQRSAMSPLALRLDWSISLRSLIGFSLSFETERLNWEMIRNGWNDNISGFFDQVPRHRGIKSIKRLKVGRQTKVMRIFNEGYRIVGSYFVYIALRCNVCVLCIARV